MIDWERVRAAKRVEADSIGEVRVSEITPSRRDFLQFAGSGRGDLEVIGALRRRDPYSGRRWDDLDVAVAAGNLDDAEVAAIAVSTDTALYGGSLEDMKTAAEASTAPILRDDLLLRPAQIHQSRMYGADAVVVPVAWLSEDDLALLIAEAEALHMAAVLAVFAAADLPRALRHDKCAIGVWGLRDDGRQDAALVEHIAASTPGRRSIILLGDVAEPAQWRQLRGRVDAALVAAPILDATSVTAGLEQLRRD